jgi:type I restriction-modification system DNA methylase subunit
MTIIKKKDIQDTFGISLATINNWIKTKVISPPDVGNNYSEKTFNEIVLKIKNGSVKLNNRANRSQATEKYINFLGIKNKERKQLLKEVISIYEQSGLSIHEGVLALSISILKYNGLFIEQTEIYKKVIEWIRELNSSIDQLDIYSNCKINNHDDDFIGAFYQSIQSISTKSITGSYYTPSDILDNIKVDNNKTVIDPCCGSGNILLNVLDKNHNPNLIYATDIDLIALQICEVNLVLFFSNPNITPNVHYQDFIFQHSEGMKYDYVVTNPPWGSKFSQNKKDSLLALYPKISTTESFSIALYNAINMLSNTGKLYFFLPYSFLNTITHKNIRKVTLDFHSKIDIKLLGHAFKGVLSEAILLNLNTNGNISHIQIENKKGSCYTIDRSQVLSPNYIITATSSNDDDEILKKIYNQKYSTLDDADFALGIVTGNNQEHILNHCTSKSEPIFRGKDIEPYKYLNPECFIEFKPDIYQQISPIQYFRTIKIAYRFISDRIVCTLDNQNRLLLNSANLFISNNYPMETIVCLFNSCIYTFIYRKKFHSTKVLKSHLKSFPLPILSAEQHLKFKSFYCDICNGKINQKDIDLEIIKLFNLSIEEYNYIQKNTDGNS